MKFDEQQQAQALVKAETMAEDFDAEEAEAFANRHQAASWYDDFMLLYQMITDDTFEVDTKTCLIIGGALAYVVMPIDMIPDFIPGIGFIDDLFVVSYVLKTLSDEIARFKKEKYV